jgi:methylated-DNA-[protein]-cysteine S-methyltransferase
MPLECVPSAFGRIDVVWNPDALGVRADGSRVTGAVTHVDLRKSRGTAKGNSVAVKLLKKWLAGDTDALLEIPVLQAGTAFKQEVWNAMRLIPAGTVASYAELAAQTSSPNAVRATASACATNQIPLIVPCHRVIRSDGYVGNYAMGTDVKIALLEHENVEITS